MAKVSCWAQSYSNNQDNILGLMGLAISGKPETVRSYVIVIIVNKCLGAMSVKGPNLVGGVRGGFSEDTKKSRPKG